MDAMTPPAMLNQMPAQQPQNMMNAAPMQGGAQNAMAPTPAPVTHDVKLLRTRKVKRAKVVPVPPEEFGIDRNARTIADSTYCFHRVPNHTEGSLIAQGYDEEQIKKLPTYTFANNTEQLARDSVDEEMWATGDDANRSARPVEIVEHYVLMDYEGNNKPCLYKVTTGFTGDVLTKDGEPDVEEFDAMPFASATPVPIPHRFFGRSIADLVMPAQREKTALKRGALDNLYLHNNPRVEVAETNAGPNTLDDLLVSRPGGVVRTKTAGGLNWQVVPDITGSIYPMMQYIDAELESRTGLSKQSQGLDANALQNQSATAVAQVFSASQLRVKLIARAMAEGVRDICSLLHAVIRKHGQEAQTVRLRNTWVAVDPRQWKTRDDMTIHVGLGTGGKAQQFAQIMALANFQKELLMGGKANLVDDKALYNTGAELIKIMGYKNPDKFLNDPSAKDPQTGQPLHPPLPPPPDPKLQIEQAKLQGQQQLAQQKAQADQAKVQADALHQQIKAQADIEVAKVKADLDAKIAVLNAHVAAIQAEQKMRMDQQAHHADMAAKAIDMVATAHQHDTKMEQGAASHQAKLQQMKTKPKGNGK
jgi:hypothetical protein